MRNILFLCLLASTFPLHAALSDKLPHHPKPEKQSLSVGKTKQHNRSFLRFLAASLAKTSAISPGNSYGKGSAIAGLGCAAAVVISWMLSPYLGFFLTIPFALAGLAFSIVARIRARRYYRNSLAAGLALAGIILNGLLLSLFLSLLLWAAS